MLTSDLELSQADFTRISDLVYSHCGITLGDGKKQLVVARLSKRMRALRIDSIAAYLQFLAADQTGEEFAHLIDAISTNLTSFFRENSHFDFLRATFLPQLTAAKRKSGSRRLRAWSAACSSGEEPYTLAMVLDESLGDSLDIKILATDISRPVLAKARLGEYDSQRVAQVPPQYRSKYFANAPGGKHKIVPELQAMIRFNYLNLMEPWPFSGPFDFVMCRNVMIYFDKPTQARLIARFFDTLEPGGLLITGHSESLTGIEHKFQYLQPTIYRKP